MRILFDPYIIPSYGIMTMVHTVAFHKPKIGFCRRPGSGAAFDEVHSCQAFGTERSGLAAGKLRRGDRNRKTEVGEPWNDWLLGAYVGVIPASVYRVLASRRRSALRATD